MRPISQLPAIDADGLRRPWQLYASYGCPFSHRVLGALALTGLDRFFEITLMEHEKREAGWLIEGGSDPIWGKAQLAQVYAAADPDYVGPASVPVVVDRAKRRIVSTDSTDLVRWISGGFNNPSLPSVNLAPERLRPEIDTLNAWLIENVNLAVYHIGLAETEEEHDKRSTALFGSLNQLDDRLSDRAFLHGAHPTESDLFLFPTLVRFEPVYAQLFRCNLRPLSDYATLSAYLQRLEAMPALAATVDSRASQMHYYTSLIPTENGLRDLNPSGIVPIR